MVANKQFRADLYYRLNVIPISLPPLRDRTADIPALVKYFVNKFSARLNKPIDVIPEDVMEVLKAHDWPGNIRELQNVIERAVVLSPESVLRLALTELKQMTKPQSPVAACTLADAEREHIPGVLKQTGGLIGGRLARPRDLVCRVRRRFTRCASSELKRAGHTGRLLARWLAAFRRRLRLSHRGAGGCSQNLRDTI